jgi:hypothetical protein
MMAALALASMLPPLVALVTAMVLVGQGAFSGLPDRQLAKEGSLLESLHV